VKRREALIHGGIAPVAQGAWKPLYLSLAIAILAALVATSARAIVIRGGKRAEILIGSNGPDVLHGSGGNDRLYGYAGKDQLFGGAGDDLLLGGRGDDLLVGGPGKDRIICGPGKDRVFRDGYDRVASDCEIVKGPTKPPAPPAPRRYALPGHYTGKTSQNEQINFDVSADGRTVRHITLNVNSSCTPPDLVSLAGRATLANEYPLAADGSFGGNESGSDGGTGTMSERIEGRADLSGRASGTFVFEDNLEFERSRYTCSSGIVTWTATSA